MLLGIGQAVLASLFREVMVGGDRQVQGLSVTR
jgi:hypothetical protein